MSASQTGPRGMTAFVPNGDSRADTATLLLGAAADAGLDASHVSSSPTFGGFWISDDLADALGADPDTVTEDADPDASDADPATEDNPEVDKAVEQLETEVPSVPDAEEAVDAAVAPEATTPTRKGTEASGNRAGKENSEEESA